MAKKPCSAYISALTGSTVIAASAGTAKKLLLIAPRSFGTAAVTLYTSNTSLLGNLIGGNTASNFSFLSVRGVYPTATMTVSFKGSEGR